jgi:hypothetical protein
MADKKKAPRKVAECDLSPLFRKLVVPCYDHISGQLGESLFELLQTRQWIRRVPGSREFEITPEGWKDLTDFGIDMNRLKTSRRKPVAACVERQGGRLYPHTGAHLGTLLTDRLFKLGWLKGKGTRNYELTEAGMTGLKLLGLKPDWFPVNNA